MKLMMTLPMYNDALDAKASASLVMTGRALSMLF